MILDGFSRRFTLVLVQTPGGSEHHLISPWDTVIHRWTEPLFSTHEPRLMAIKWAALHPENSRPAEPKEVKRSALDRFRNRLASALWVR